MSVQVPMSQGPEVPKSRSRCAAYDISNGRSATSMRRVAPPMGFPAVSATAPASTTRYGMIIVLPIVPPWLSPNTAVTVLPTASTERASDSKIPSPSPTTSRTRMPE